MSRDYLSDRDFEIFELMLNFGGRIYSTTLENTFFATLEKPDRQARNRMNTLCSRGFLQKKLTGRTNPRFAYVPTPKLREIVTDKFNRSYPASIKITPATLQHVILEQIVYFWLKKLGKNVQRTIVKTWSMEHNHTPDLFYISNNKKFYVEIETNRKTNRSYSVILSKILQDKIDKVIYIVPTLKQVEGYAKRIDKAMQEDLYILDIDTFVENAKNGKFIAQTQKTILEAQNG
jgi:hypothetical protein